jgi:hypothetical protein
MINVILQCCAMLACYTLYASDALKQIPLVDGSSLYDVRLVDGILISVDIPSKPDIAKTNNLLKCLENSSSESVNFISAFAELNSLACNLDIGALFFFFRMFESGTIREVKLKGLTKQPERAQWFKRLYDVCLSFSNSNNYENSLLRIKNMRGIIVH